MHTGKKAFEVEALVTRSGMTIVSEIDKLGSILQYSDTRRIHLYFSGGIRAEKSNDGLWTIVPIFANDCPCAFGPIELREIQRILGSTGVQAVAFHDFGRMSGSDFSTWHPVIPGRKNHSRSPADFWSSIASNIAKRRIEKNFKERENLTIGEFSQVWDQMGHPERLSRFIGISLRGLDVCVRQIGDFYHSRLIDHLRKGNINNDRVATTLDQELYSHVHSFFMHIGAIRDYLGAFIACETGRDPLKVDSMPRLLQCVQDSDMSKNKILNYLNTNGFISISQKSKQWRVSGWLRDAKNLRDRFINQRPYGGNFVEFHGHLRKIKEEIAIYRYFRSVHINNKGDIDVFDEILRHYQKMSSLMLNAAILSDYIYETIKIDEEDVIDIQVES